MRMRIADLLEEGSENAMKSDVLMMITGISDRRVLQSMIEREREQGELICASEHGYYLCGSREEARSYYRHASSGALKQLRTLRHIRAFAEELDGQVFIGGVESE